MLNNGCGLQLRLYPQYIYRRIQVQNVTVGKVFIIEEKCYIRIDSLSS